MHSDSTVNIGDAMSNRIKVCSVEAPVYDEDQVFLHVPLRIRPMGVLTIEFGGNSARDYASARLWRPAPLAAPIAHRPWPRQLFANRQRPSLPEHFVQLPVAMPL